MGSLEGRVAIVTGAGRGIGREHALLLAREGAQIVVNDFGGAPDGTAGGDSRAAQSVVDEIVAAGGSAVANIDSVSDFDGALQIVNTAVETFGDLHIVVNNAGIIRNKPLVSMTEADFDQVIAVNLKGTFCINRWAAAYWLEEFKSGVTVARSIINTASESWLYGEPGKFNYSAASAGVAAMTAVGGIELEPYGVRTNCIVPVARTRLTMQVPSLAEKIDNPIFDPGNISPLVAVLAGESCGFNGQMFRAYGGSVGIYSGGSICDEISTETRWTVEDLATALDDLSREMRDDSRIAAFSKSVLS